MTLHFHPEALREFQEATQYYERINHDLGAQFYYAIERLIFGTQKRSGKVSHLAAPCQKTL